MDQLTSDFWNIWGRPVTATTCWQGVCLFVRKSQFWAARPVQWKVTDPCYEFWLECRLVAAQVWYGDGNKSFFIYCMYGKPRTRTDTPDKVHFRRMISAITTDVASRGNVMAFFGGDFNSIPNEPGALVDRQRTGEWQDSWLWGDADQRLVNTSTGGQGQRIDGIFLNYIAADHTKKYYVDTRPGFKTHRPVCVDVSLPGPRQYRKRARKIEPVRDMPKPSADQVRTPVQMPPAFRNAIDAENTGAALKIWCKVAEEILLALADQCGCKQESQRGRGKVRIETKRACPPTVGDCAYTRATRAIEKAISRCKEVARCTNPNQSCRIQRTWEAISSVAAFCTSVETKESLSKAMRGTDRINSDETCK